jgi:hypothetical protein
MSPYVFPQAEKRRVMRDPVFCINKGGHPNGYPPLLKIDYNMDKMR